MVESWKIYTYLPGHIFRDFK